MQNQNLNPGFSALFRFLSSRPCCCPHTSRAVWPLYLCLCCSLNPGYLAPDYHWAKFWFFRPKSWAISSPKLSWIPSPIRIEQLIAMFSQHTAWTGIQPCLYLPCCVADFHYNPLNLKLQLSPFSPLLPLLWHQYLTQAFFLSRLSGCPFGEWHRSRANLESEY